MEFDSYSVKRDSGMGLEDDDSLRENLPKGLKQKELGKKIPLSQALFSNSIFNID
jgi:hypothetical protein